MVEYANKEAHEKWLNNLKEYQEQQYKEETDKRKREEKEHREAIRKKEQREREIKKLKSDNEKRKRQEEKRLAREAWLKTPEGRKWQAHQENIEKYNRDRASGMSPEEIEARNKDRLHALNDGRSPYTLRADPKKNLK